MTEPTEPRSTKITSLYSISHEKDADGFISAAIVWRYAKSKDLKHSVMLTDYGSFEAVFKKVGGFKNTLIVVTDLGLDENSLGKVISSLTRATAQGCRVVWLDHHEWPDRAVKSILSLANSPVLRINHEYCGAEIAFKVLLPRDDVCAEMAKIAHDTDFNIREIESASALTDALSLIRFAVLDKGDDLTAALLPLLRSLAETGMTGIWDETGKRFRDVLLNQRVDNYRKERLKKMRKALAAHCDLEVHGRLVRMVEMPNGVTTTDMGTFVADTKNLIIGDRQLPVADLFVTLSPGGMLGFRRGRDSVVCNAAAALFKGGGHAYAAGGEYGPYHDFQAVCDDVFSTLSKSKDWVVASSEESA
jgi:oligoribonuclease NrnB/cAMP/cGMP phosphodiesterase (DHH superfamily)